MKKGIPYKWELVIWLFIAFFFNQADRQIFNVLLLDIQRDLGLTPDKMGLVGSSLLLVNGILVPIAGILGDRVNKKWLLAGSLLLWSTATMLTGLSMGLPALILLRSVATGGGEAFYTPSANKIISENHPEETRATALSIHQSALYVGFIVSGVIATVIAKAYGWRHSFFLFGGFGIALAIILAFRLKNDKKPEGPREPVLRLFGDGLKAFFGTPSIVLLAIACAGFQFAGQAFLVWTPTFLQEGLGVDPTRAAFDASFYTQMASIAGVMIGARLSDSQVRRHPRARLWVQAIGFALGAPFLVMLGKGRTEWVMCAAMAGYGLFKGFYDSNIFAAVYDLIDQRYRAMATSFMLMFSLIIGSISPYLLGVLQSSGLSLSDGMALMGLVFFLSAVPVVAAGIWTFRKDRERVAETA